MNIVPLVEAFRDAIRRAAPDRADLLEISSYRWFHERQKVNSDGSIAKRAEDGPAYAALEEIRSQQQARKLRLRGTLGFAPPADIDPIDVHRGEIDVFAGTLKIYASPGSFDAALIYANVHVYVDEPSPPSIKRKSGRRAVYDWGAIKAFTFEQLAARGDFDDEDQMKGWRAAADLYRSIQDRFGDDAPETTMLKQNVPAFVEEWRAKKVGN